MRGSVFVDVTYEELRKGQRGRCGYCPLALAIQKARPDWSGISVGAYSVIFRDKQGVLYESNIPHNILYSVWAFDRGSHVDPYSFTLERFHRYVAPLEEDYLHEYTSF